MKKTIATPPGKPNIEVEATEEEKRDRERREAKHKRKVQEEGHVGVRVEEYGDPREQLDMIYWDMVNGTTKWKDHVAAVKAKYPKAEVR